MDADILIRPAVRHDCPAILDIYNEAVLNTTATYDYEPRSAEDGEAWFDSHQRDGLPVLVAETSAGGTRRLAGWSSLSRFHHRPGYRFTVEDSIYIAPAWRGRRLGRRLVEPLIEFARGRNFHVIVAGVDASNEASLKLHASLGFQPVSRFKEVGYKFGRWLDVVHLQLTLPCRPDGV